MSILRRDCPKKLPDRWVQKSAQSASAPEVTGAQRFVALRLRFL
jgi:hypothetical protein